MLRGNIAATSLIILWKNLFSVKCYDKSIMNVFALSLWEIFGWGVICFDQSSADGPWSPAFNIYQFIQTVFM